jgi:hypothetical protein
MNSYWIPSINPLNMVRVQLSTEDLSSSNTSLTVGFPGQKTMAQVTTLEDLFVCHDAWLGILLISALALFLCSLVGLVLKFFTKGQKILGHVSSLTRDSAYVHVPAGGSTLDGYERARLLKDVKIKIRDAAAGNTVGHVAVMSVDGIGHVNERPNLDKRRFYI